MAHKGYAATQAAGPRRHQDEGFQGAHQERVSRPSPTLRACIRAHKRVVVVVAVVVATKSLLLVRPYRRYHYRTTTSAAALLPSPSSIARLPNPPRPPPQASLLLSLVPPCRILIIYNLASRQPQTKPLAATDHCAIRLPSWCCSCRDAQAEAQGRGARAAPPADARGLCRLDRQVVQPASR